MRYLGLSDLHIGAGKSDLFKHKDSAFIQFLEEANVDKVILVGDVIDIWRYPFLQIKHAHPELIEYILNSPKIIYLKGNHDDSLYFPEQTIIDTVLFEHGHQEEMRYANPVSMWCSKYFLRMLAIFENRFNFSLSRFYMQYVEPLRESVLYWLLNDIKRYALKYYHQNILQIKEDFSDIIAYEVQMARKNKCSTVVFGHTHRRMDKMINGVRVINLGCSYDRIEAVVIDGDTINTIKLKVLE